MYSVDEKIIYEQFFYETIFEQVVVLKSDLQTVRAKDILEQENIIKCVLIDNYLEAKDLTNKRSIFLASDKKQIEELRNTVGRFAATTIEYIKNRFEICTNCLVYSDEKILTEYNNIKTYLENNNVKVYNYIMPVMSEINELTPEEQLIWRRRKETIKYSDVEEDEELYIKVFGKYDNKNDISKVINRIAIVERNGIKYHADYKSDLLNVVNGRRLTIDVPAKPKRRIYIFGKSNVYGYAVEDMDTIASNLQRFINSNIGEEIEVVNMGVSAIEDADINKLISSVDYNSNDIVIYIYLKRRCYKGICKDLEDFVSFKETFNNVTNRPAMFLDSISHLNYLGNEILAKKIFGDIKEHLISSMNCPSTKIDKQEINRKIYELEHSYSENEDLKKYLSYIKEYRVDNYLSKRIGAIVMNCNPFTLGHRYLIENAAKRVDKLYIFVVEEDKSVFTFEDRIELVRKGTMDLKNVIVLPSGNFMISSLTFPEYFEKEKDKDIIIDASLDMDIFGAYIAKELGVTVRFAGEEPNDMVTRQYNKCMSEKLPEYGIDFVEIPRKHCGDKVISATTVRAYLKEKNFDEIEKLVPTTTLEYLKKNYM